MDHELDGNIFKSDDELDGEIFSGVYELPFTNVGGKMFHCFHAEIGKNVDHFYFDAGKVVYYADAFAVAVRINFCAILCGYGEGEEEKGKKQYKYFFMGHFFLEFYYISYLYYPLFFLFFNRSIW